MVKTLLAFFALLLLGATAARAEDGYRLWLRYDPIEAPQRALYAANATEIVAPGAGPVSRAAAGANSGNRKKASNVLTIVTSFIAC